MSNRKLIRPSLAEIKEQLTVRQPRGRRPIYYWPVPPRPHSCMQPTIGITAGDPAGIGLEVVLKSIAAVLDSARWILFTDRAIFKRNAELFSPGIEFKWIDSVSEVTDS